MIRGIAFITALIALPIGAIAGMALMIGQTKIGVMEGRFWPAAASMRLTAIEADGDGRQAFRGVSERLRPLCDFDDLEWFIGDRGGRNVPMTVDEGPPIVREDGIFTFGPWFAYGVTSSEFISEGFSDALHRCRWWYGGPYKPWRVRSPFWN